MRPVLAIQRSTLGEYLAPRHFRTLYSSSSENGEWAGHLLSIYRNYLEFKVIYLTNDFDCSTTIIPPP